MTSSGRADPLEGGEGRGSRFGEERGSRPDPPDYLPRSVIEHAQMLVGAVRERDAAAVRQVLDGSHVAGVAVALAAMVPDDLTARQLLRWNDGDAPNEPALRPHGTHAAWARHKRRGEEPCSVCVFGEHRYRRSRR